MNPPDFLFGASLYPEIMTPEEWAALLDLCGRCHFTGVRLGESAWGNLESAPGRYEFGWLERALEDLRARGLAAVLGTSTYVAPVWLFEAHPDVAVRLDPGVAVHPMYRKAASLTHPAYRGAAARLVGALGRAFAGHPAVVAWQLDNEIDAASVLAPDYNPSAEAAWTEWLAARFGTVERMNEALGLRAWGWSAPSFAAVPQPRARTTEGSSRLPALHLLNRAFRRDVVAGFLAEQSRLLRGAGVAAPLFSNWMTNRATLADDPDCGGARDLTGLNVYPLGPDREAYWREHAWFLDAARCSGGRNRFLVAETRVGVTGNVRMHDPFPSRAEFRLWMWGMAGFGAEGLVYWSGTRWHAGHWPHWGAMVGFDGRPEPDTAWIAELGEEFARLGPALKAAPVAATAAVVTDHDQRNALEIYPHVPSGPRLVPEAFGALHRLGTGADALDARRLARGVPEAVRLLVVAGAPTLGDEAVPALEAFVARGGALLVGPVAGYQTAEGVFRRDGLGGGLAALCGARTASLRRMGVEGEPEGARHVARWSEDWGGADTPLALEGLLEILDPDGEEAEALATLVHEEPILAGRPVATLRQIGPGAVLRLGFWPGDDALPGILARLARLVGLDAAPLPPDVRAVPRADGSRFLLNFRRTGVTVPLPAATDRLTGRAVGGPTDLRPHEVLWLAPT